MSERLTVEDQSVPRRFARARGVHGMKRLRLVHEWHPWNRLDTYVEHETLDLTGPRSRAERVSEVNHAVRAYSPEGGRWDLDNGVLKRAGKEALARDLALFLATPGHPMKTGVLP